MEHACALPGTSRVSRPALPGFAQWTYYLTLCSPLHGAGSCTSTPLPLHFSYITHFSIVTRSRRHLVRAQMNKADKCRTHEQQTQQKQEKQRNQQKQKQQKQTGGGKNCVSSLSPDPAGTASADGIEARIPVI